MRIATLLCAVLLCAGSAWGQSPSREASAIPELQRRSDLPAKPESRIGYLGQFIAEGEPMPEIPANLVMVPQRHDGREQWHLEEVNTCFWCGEPMSFKEAMTDPPMLRWLAVRTALAVADIEVTHHSPCFQAGDCREGNPLLGQTRAQAYSVNGGVIFGSWLIAAHLHKGDKAHRMGGLKAGMLKWVWLAHGAGSVAGIVANLARR